MKNGSIIALVVSAVLGATMAGLWYRKHGFAVGLGDQGTSIVRFRAPHAAPAEDNDAQIAVSLAKNVAAYPYVTNVRVVSTHDGVDGEITYSTSDPATQTVAVEAVDRQLASVPGKPRGTAWLAGGSAHSIWVLSADDIGSKLDAIDGAWRESCGGSKETRLRVTVDVAKLRAIGADALDLQAALDAPNPATAPLKGGAVSDVAMVKSMPARNVCTAWAGDRDGRIFAYAIHPRSDANVAPVREALARATTGTSARIIDANDAIEARIIGAPNTTRDTQQRTVADLVVLVRSMNSLTLLLAEMQPDGTGTLLFSKNSLPNGIRSLIASDPNVAWGGITGEHRVKVAITGTDFSALNRRAADIEKQISKLDGVGPKITLAPEPYAKVVYDVDDNFARALGVTDVKALHTLAEKMEGDGDDSVEVVVDPPRPLFVKDISLDALMTKKEKMVPAALLRVNGKPTVERAWEIRDAASAARVRQVLGATADVSVTVEPTF